MELVTGHQAGPHITAAQVSRFIQGVTVMDDTTVYRLHGGNECAITATDLDLAIDTGEMVLHGFHVTNETAYNIGIDPVFDASKTRIDKIVLEIVEDMTTGIQTANIVVVQGTEATTPVAPATPSTPSSPTELFLAVGVIAQVTATDSTISVLSDLTELYAGSYVTDEMFKIVRRPVTDEYDSTKAYTTGEYTIHDNKLYVCTANCSAAAWNVNQTNFSETSLTAATTALNSALTQLKHVKYEEKEVTFSNGLATVTHNLGKNNHVIPIPYGSLIPLSVFDMYQNSFTMRVAYISQNNVADSVVATNYSGTFYVKYMLFY